MSSVDKNERILGILVILLILVIAYLSLENDEAKEKIVCIESVKTDTLLKIEPARTVIKKDTAKIEYKGDTVYSTKAFDAKYTEKIDDARIDSVAITYSYPDNKFTYEISLKPDTNTIYERTVLKTESIEEPNEWYESLWFSVTSGVAGLIIGVYITK